jgi:acyl-CoA reductase-like NAD-dependent aldehyde dehydrogenase
MALADLAPETRAYIDGELVESSNGARFDNVNPATGQVIGTAVDGTKDDADRALAAARRASDDGAWAADPAFRARSVRQLYEGMLAEKEQLRSIVVRECGAPVSLTGFMHVDNPIEMMSYWADKAASDSQPRKSCAYYGKWTPAREQVRWVPC